MEFHEDSIKSTKFVTYNFSILRMTLSEIRQAFFDYFETKNHEIVSSAPMVVKNDPTLMFINAGMNQFKDYFLR